jgi:hypothetical protein
MNGKCVEVNGSFERDIFFNFVDCDEGCGPEKSEPKPLRVNCTFKCDFGEYFDITNRNYTVCPDGKTSEKHALVFDTWDKIPDAIVVNEFPWIAAGPYFTTGLQEKQTNMEFHIEVDIQTTGESVSYTFQQYKNDFFSSTFSFSFFLSINCTCQIDEERINVLESDIWQVVSYNLSFGRHKLSWKYFHKSNWDGARIKSIVIEGEIILFVYL